MVFSIPDMPTPPQPQTHFLRSFLSTATYLALTRVAAFLAMLTNLISAALFIDPMLWLAGYKFGIPDVLRDNCYFELRANKGFPFQSDRIES